MSKKRSSLKRAQDTYYARGKKIDFTLPFQKFIEEVYETHPGRYGTAIAKKILLDLEGLLVSIKASLNNGDASDNKGIVFEIKTSFESIMDLFNLTHLRGHYQNFDYYIICLITTPEFIPRFYCIHKTVIQNNIDFKLSSMDGNKISNAENKNVDKRFTFHRSQVDNLIARYNVLGGTEYSDLEFFLLKRNGMKYRKGLSNGKYFKSTKRKVATREV